MFEDPRYVRSLMELGASACLVKTSSSEHLVAAVRAAVFDPRAKNAVVGMPLAMLEESRDGVEGVLSARELELLLLAARGLSNRQIAASTYLAEATVKRHLANIYQKMGVSSTPRPQGGAPEGLDHHRGRSRSRQTRRSLRARA